ncbi:MAG: hypothetical protein JJT78_05660 [Leptospira sp.]|nr:hypothetical protein [Leptospira sp.]
MYFKRIFGLFILIHNLIHCQDIKRPGIEALFLLQGSPQNIGVITSDFGGGGRYNVVDPRGGFALPGLTPIHSDASVRFFNGKIFIINRLNRDSIQILNPSIANITEQEFSVGQGTNPHDIAIIDENKAYISRYNSKSMLIVNPTNGVRIGEIDLSAYAETQSQGTGPDGLPEMSWMVQHQGRIFVTIQRLDRNNPQGFLPPTDRSYLLELDPVTNTPKTNYTFQATNPISKPQVINIFGDDHIIIATPGRIGFISELDGGVEAFNLRTNEFRPGFLLDERVAGGDILGVQIRNENLGFASILDKEFNKKIIQFNPSNGSILSNLVEVPNSVSTNFSGLLITSDGLLAVGVSDINSPGILVYDTNGGVRQISPFPVRTELTPTGLIELQ